MFSGDLLDFHLTVLSNADARTKAVSVEDAEWIGTYFETANRLAAGSRQFKLALEAAIDWRFAKEPRSAIARLWCGIEAVFGITSELVYRLSLLSACLLAERGVPRREKFNEVKKLYGLRSKVVHGEHLSDADLAKALNDSFLLLSDLLKLSIREGHALGAEDFDTALFG